MSLNIILYLSSFLQIYLQSVSTWQYNYILIIQFCHSTSVNVRLSNRFRASFLWMLSSLFCIIPIRHNMFYYNVFIKWYNDNFIVWQKFIFIYYYQFIFKNEKATKYNPNHKVTGYLFVCLYQRISLIAEPI